MKYKYKSILLNKPSVAFRDEKTILRPIIPIELINGDRKIRTFALIDSGADYCIFDEEFENLLGLSGGNPDNFGGINGAITVGFFHNIKMDIGGQRKDLYCCFAKISKLGYGILGQRGFFDLYKVSFDYQKGEIEIREN